MRHPILAPPLHPSASTSFASPPSAIRPPRFLRRKRDRALVLPLIFLLTTNLLASVLVRLPQVHAVDILDFSDSTGLPECAHNCTDLHAAELECMNESEETAAVKCFCVSAFMDPKERDGVCGYACQDPEDRGRVKGWLDGVCRSVEKASSTKTISPTASPTFNPEKTTADIEKKKEEEKESWWTKNWPYFLLAFLLTTIPILILVFSAPARRFTQRFFIRRRVRKSGLPDVAYNHWTPPQPGSMASLGAPFLGVAGAAGRGMLGDRGVSGETTQTQRTYLSAQTARTNLTSNTGASSWFEGEWLGSPKPDGWPNFAYEGAAGVAGTPVMVQSPGMLSPGLPTPATQAGVGIDPRTGGAAVTGGFRGSGYIVAEDESADLGTYSTHRSRSLGRTESRPWRGGDDNGRGSYIGVPHNGRQWDEEEWTPKPLASSVRQESWERRLRAKFDRSKSSGDENGLLGKLAFWKRGGSGDSGGGYGRVGESGFHPGGKRWKSGIWSPIPGGPKSPEEEGSLGF